MTTPLSPYQKRLIAFLSVATFFEGYDFLALAQILPNLRADFGLTRTEGGWLVGAINVGTVIAALLVRKADAWGRRRLLTVTIAGYTLCSLATAAAPDALVFGVLQLAARVFLIGEWATAMVIAAEEFPADRRGFVIGVIQACSSLGSVACAGLVPALLHTSLGWRTVYLVGGIPLVIVAYARRGLRETTRFSTQVTGEAQPFTRLWTLPVYRKRMLQLAVIWCVSYVATNNAVTFWKEFVVGERGWTNAQVGASISIAAVAAMPFIFLAGRLIDRLGRRVGALIIFVLTAAGIAASYTLHDHVALTIALGVAIFGTTATLPVLNAYTTELFPTDLRGDAFAWANNLLGRIGYVGSPIVIGVLAETLGYGPVLAWAATSLIVAVILIWVLLPETSGRELEETSAAS